MDEKKFLEELFGMMPDDCQDIYNDTIPEAKEVRAKMKGKKKGAPIPDYACGYEMFEDIRALDYKSQAQVCKAQSLRMAKTTVTLWHKLAIQM